MDSGKIGCCGIDRYDKCVLCNRCRKWWHQGCLGMEDNHPKWKKLCQEGVEFLCKDCKKLDKRNMKVSIFATCQNCNKTWQEVGRPRFRDPLTGEGTCKSCYTGTPWLVAKIDEWGLEEMSLDLHETLVEFVGHDRYGPHDLRRLGAQEMFIPGKRGDTREDITSGRHWFYDAQQRIKIVVDFEKGRTLVAGRRHSRKGKFHTKHQQNPELFWFRAYNDYLNLMTNNRGLRGFRRRWQGSSEGDYHRDNMELVRLEITLEDLAAEKKKQEEEEREAFGEPLVDPSYTDKVLWMIRHLGRMWVAENLDELIKGMQRYCSFYLSTFQCKMDLRFYHKDKHSCNFIARALISSRVKGYLTPRLELTNKGRKYLDSRPKRSCGAEEMEHTLFTGASLTEADLTVAQAAMDLTNGRETEAWEPSRKRKKRQDLRCSKRQKLNASNVKVVVIEDSDDEVIDLTNDSSDKIVVDI